MADPIGNNIIQKLLDVLAPLDLNDDIVYKNYSKLIALLEINANWIKNPKTKNKWANLAIKHKLAIHDKLTLKLVEANVQKQSNLFEQDLAKINQKESIFIDRNFMDNSKAEGKNSKETNIELKNNNFINLEKSYQQNKIKHFLKEVRINQDESKNLKTLKANINSININNRYQNIIHYKSQVIPNTFPLTTNINNFKNNIFFDNNNLNRINLGNPSFYPPHMDFVNYYPFTVTKPIQQNCFNHPSNNFYNN